MASILDGQVGIKQESTPGTPVTVDRFYEVSPDSTHNFDPMRITGDGLRVGTNGPRVDRITKGPGNGTITLKANALSKGFGVLYSTFCATYASTNVSGATYQQRGIPTMTTVFRPSFTIQVGAVSVDGSSTSNAHTYAGCVATAFELDAPERGIPTISVTFWAQSLATGTALASASYPSAATQYSDSASLAGTTLGGSLTVPTTTALASGGTAATNIRSWTFTGDLGVNQRPALGGWQRPTFGKASYSLKVGIDYDANTLRDLQISQGSTSFTGYFIGGALSTGTERLELDVPAMVLDDGAFGQLTAGDSPVLEPTFTVADNGTDALWYLVSRTADTAA